MKKIKSIFKGIVKGVRDILPVPSTAAERETMQSNVEDSVTEAITEKITSRGVMAIGVVYLLDQIFSFGLFM